MVVIARKLSTQTFCLHPAGRMTFKPQRTKTLDAFKKLIFTASKMQLCYTGQFVFGAGQNWTDIAYIYSNFSGEITMHEVIVSSSGRSIHFAKPVPRNHKIFGSCIRHLACDAVQIIKVTLADQGHMARPHSDQN
jgi:hypothetical protein